MADCTSFWLVNAAASGEGLMDPGTLVPARSFNMFDDEHINDRALRFHPESELPEYVSQGLTIRIGKTGISSTGRLSVRARRPWPHQCPPIGLYVVKDR